MIRKTVLVVLCLLSIATFVTGVVSYFKTPRWRGWPMLVKGGVCTPVPSGPAYIPRLSMKASSGRATITYSVDASELLEEHRRLSEEAGFDEDYPPLARLHEREFVPRRWALGGASIERVIRVPGGRVWAVSLPLWMPFVVFSSYPLLTFVHHLRHRRRYRLQQGLCVTCGYDLTGNVSGICSECGTKIETG
jgi:hypothetical protein